MRRPYPARRAEGRSHRSPLHERWLARVPRLYSPIAHLLANVVGSGVVIAWLISSLPPSGIRPWAWLAVPIAFVAANMFEYLYHRYPMHRRMRLLHHTFRRHTLQHHRFFTHEIMEVQSRAELFFVNFAVQMALVALVLVSLAFAVLRPVIGPDVAALVGITFVVYFLLVEWFHLTFHLPLRWFERAPFAGLWRWLREHHRAHHDPRRMTRENFNITFPLTDWLCGTLAGQSDDAAAPQGASAGRRPD